MEHGFFDPFDQVRVINLRRRSDRRIEVINELRRIGVSVDGSHVAFFDAIEPTDAERFRSIGARGCFYSHLEVLRRAQSGGACNLLILEDDAHFSRTFRVSARQVEVALKGQEWDLFYAGYAAHSSIALEQPLGRISPSLSLMTSHAVGFSPRAIDRVIPYLETMLTRPNGHPDGGPMDIDGA